MIGATQAIVQWLSQFELPVYGEQDVPHDAELPYITMQVKEPEWDHKTSLLLQVWYYTKENSVVLAKADEIAAAVGVGVRIPFQGGIAVLWPDTPLIQLLVNKNERRAVISLQMNSYHCPGV